MSTQLATDTLTKLKTPSLYKVVVLNDDFTPMDFVIQIFEEIFGKSQAEAYRLTMDIHEKGRGIGGVYSKEVAEQKSYECNHVSRANKHPLKSVIEQA